MNLIIVESPTKAKTLSRFLGKDYDVTATKGHIKDLPKSKLSVDTERKFAPDYQVVEKRKAEINDIKKSGKRASKIFIATDPDREGEAIAAHVQEILEGVKSPISRIVFHEITKDAVTEAIAHPREVDKNLVNAQISRRVLDRLVGYKLSPLLWKKVRVGLSAGRVQSVAVRLIVEREREIGAFKPTEFWEIYVELKKKEQFRVQLVKIDGKAIDIGNKTLADKIVADLSGAKYIVAEVKKREVRKNPYAPFTTSTMTQAGATMFGWSAKRTMSLAQRLYEAGHITYHRTDSINIAITAIQSVREYIGAEVGQEYLPSSPRIYKTSSKSAQEAHEAIRPTQVGNRKLEIDPSEQKLYELIWKRYVACQMKEAVYDETTIEVLADPSSAEASKYLLRASGQIIKFDGWRKIYGGIKADDAVQKLPDVAKSDQLDLVKVDPLQKFTQPPARYNEASLIKTLEKLGIGRPSTYAPTISTIQVRSYVEKKDGKFFATPVGVAVNDFLITNFPEVVDYAFTASMEDDLDKVAAGKLVWQDRIGKFYTPFEGKLADVEKNAQRVKIEVEKLGKPCPTCREGELVIRVGRFGKFISCSRFPECKYTEKFLDKIGVTCPDCNKGDVIVKKSGKGRSFYGCSRYPECKWASWKNPKLQTPVATG